MLNRSYWNCVYEGKTESLILEHYYATNWLINNRFSSKISHNKVNGYYWCVLWWRTLYPSVAYSIAFQLTNHVSACSHDSINCPAGDLFCEQFYIRLTIWSLTTSALVNCFNFLASDNFSVYIYLINFLVSKIIWNLLKSLETDHFSALDHFSAVLRAKPEVLLRALRGAQFPCEGVDSAFVDSGLCFGGLAPHTRLSVAWQQRQGLQCQYWCLATQTRFAQSVLVLPWHENYDRDEVCSVSIGVLPTEARFERQYRFYFGKKITT